MTKLKFPQWALERSLSLKLIFNDHLKLGEVTTLARNIKTRKQ